MTDGGALPLAFSDLVAKLRECGLIDATVTAGNAFGGDAEATTFAHALHAASDLGADAVIAGIGPGSLGVGDDLAYTGREVMGLLETAIRPVLAIRYSDADPRERHRGVSVHTCGILEALLRPVHVAIPTGEPHTPELEKHWLSDVEVPDIIPSLEELGVTSMGRKPAEDPKFWLYAGAAGAFAAGLSQ
jgi:hypothetical protein